MGDTYMSEKERRELLYLEHTWIDVFRLPLLLEIGVICISIPAYFYSVHKYGYFIKAASLSDWIIVIAVLLLIYVAIPGLFAVILYLQDAQSDEEFYLEDDEIIYKNGKLMLPVKAEDIIEIFSEYNNRFSIQITFKFRKEYDKIVRGKKKGRSKGVAFGGTVVFRRWITEGEINEKVIEIWGLLKKYNPDIELKRFNPHTKHPEQWTGKNWVQIDWNEALA